MSERFGARLSVGEFKEEPPGFFAGAKPERSLSLHLPAAVDLERLLVDMVGPSAVPGPRRVEWVAISACGDFGWVSGRIPSLEIEARVLEAGLGVTFSGAVDALGKPAGFLEPLVPVPALADSRVQGEIVIPWAYLIIQQSPLASLGSPFQAPWKQGDPLFDLGRPGLSGVAFNRSNGLPIFQGPFVVERGVSSSCVLAQDIDKMLVLDAAKTPWLLADGFAAAQSLYAPRLTLFGMGHDMWAKILGGERAGYLEVKGDCVGFLTEAWVLGAVAGRHAISTYRIDLALSETELALKIKGQADRLLQYEGPPLKPTMGPGFDVTMRIPVAFLAARGIDLVRWGASEKRLLKGESIQ